MRTFTHPNDQQPEVLAVRSFSRALPLTPCPDCCIDLQCRSADPKFAAGLGPVVAPSASCNSNALPTRTSAVCRALALLLSSPTTFNLRTSPPEPSMEALEELVQKTRELRRSLMATTVIVDASVTVRNEWVSVVKDYVGPQLNYIGGKFLDHQVHDTGPPNQLCLLIYIWSFSSE